MKSGVVPSADETQQFTLGRTGLNSIDVVNTAGQWCLQRFGSFLTTIEHKVTTFKFLTR